MKERQITWADFCQLQDRLSKAQSVCGEAYQIIAALRFDDSTVPILDNLSAASGGDPIPHETCLPFIAGENK